MRFLWGLFLLFVLLSTVCQGQENFLLTGKIKAEGKAVANVHIVNLSSSVGTISSDAGLFSIPVKVGDSILISSLSYQRLTLGISAEIEKQRVLSIQLTPKVEQLDEVQFTGLTGNLEYDLQQLPEDSIPEIGYKYSPSDLNKKLKSDELMNQSKVNAEDFVNPIAGAGAAIGLPDKRLLREQQLKRTLKLKKEFPDKLIKEFGILYFTKTLGIAEANIPHFISFCEPKNLFEKFRNNNILEVIELLKTESKLYHELQD